MSGPHGVRIGDVHLLIGDEDASTARHGVAGLLAGLLLGSFGGFDKRVPVLRVSKNGKVIAERRFRSRGEAEWARDAIAADPPDDDVPDWQAILDRAGGV